MAPKELAKAGVWLLKQATLDYLATEPQGVSAPDARAASGLDEDKDEEGGRRGHLFWGLLNLLIADGKVSINRNTTPHRIMLARQPEAKA
jgi:hypothetical protein